MKKTNFFGMAFSLLFVFVLFNSSASAQSTDPDNPTVVTQSAVQGKNPGNGEVVVYYYTFTAGPGILKLTTDQKSRGIRGNEKLSWELLDANFKGLASEELYGVTTSERKVNEVKLAKSQKVILKVKVTEDVENFKFQFAGAVNFAGGNSNENIQEITGDNTT
ncbi:MAG: hypothetical protein WBP93_07480, partial [Pyrinomonadaceae bacterium]